MVSKEILRPILANEAITRGLGDPEARVLIEWLVGQAEKTEHQGQSSKEAIASVERLCRRARAISRFVTLWGHPRERGGAYQLAATELFPWPLPTTDVDPCELMIDILAYESC
jgi:hypothetical protein